MIQQSDFAEREPSRKAGKLIDINQALSKELGKLTFGAPVTHVYNPLEYARDPAEQYLKLASAGQNRVVLLGMNPGPWGMAQTGVPFGTVDMVKDWLLIDGLVGKPQKENPRRPIRGFDEKRQEVSGTRFWGWAQERFSTPQNFFDQFFVANFCPLVFMEESGKNRTPDKLPAGEKKQLNSVCDEALRQVVEVLVPELVIGIGKFAEDRARAALDGSEMRIGRILHPSPASPVANRGWSAQADSQFERLGIKMN